MGSVGSNLLNINLSQTERDLIADWSLLGYQNLKNSDDIEEIINKLPKYKNKLYRGLSMRQSAINSLSIGDNFKLGGITSWTTTQEKAKTFSNLSYNNIERGNPVRVVLSVAKPKQSVDISNYTKFQTEKEVLTSGKVNYTIDNISKSKMIVYDYMGRKQSVDVYKIELK